MKYEWIYDGPEMPGLSVSVPGSKKKLSLKSN